MTEDLKGKAEHAYIRYLIEKKYPTGILSLVSDTFDYWRVLTHVLPKLKDKIMSRDGKVVIRPDSGDPVKILCGDPTASHGSAEFNGTIEQLWSIFGGTVNTKGFRQLDSHIGAIYGDSITRERCYVICQKLKERGFASTNVVYGVGSYTYQYVTRDTLGIAMKATHGVIDGKSVDIYKDPKTDSGLKKSARGLLRVNADYTLSQQVSEKEEQSGVLETVFLDGKMVREHTLSEIRTRLLSHL